MLNAVAKLIGQGEEWPTDGTAHLGRDEWELAKERLRIRPHHRVAVVVEP